MKKSRVLAVVLAVSIMLMGVGYAYWSDSVQITSTVSTGDLKVDFTDPAYASETTYTDDPLFTGTVCKATVDPEGDSKMSFELKNFYPGAESTLLFTLVNEGSIGAYVDEFKLTENDLRGNLLCTYVAICDAKLIEDNGWQCDLENKEIVYKKTENDDPITLADALKLLNTAKLNNGRVDGQKDEGLGIYLEHNGEFSAPKYRAGVVSRKTVIIRVKVSEKLNNKNFEQSTLVKGEDGYELESEKTYKFNIDASVYQFNDKNH